MRHVIFFKPWRDGHHIPARVRESQRVIEAVAVSVVGLRTLFVLDHDVGREHPSEDWVIETSVHVDQVELVVMLMEGVAAVEGVAHVVVAEVSGVAPAAPRVIAQPFHGAAVDNRRKAALVVLQRVVHGASSVLCHKDSEDSNNSTN